MFEIGSFGAVGMWNDPNPKPTKSKSRKKIDELEKKSVPKQKKPNYLKAKPPQLEFCSLDIPTDFSLNGFHRFILFAWSHYKPVFIDLHTLSPLRTFIIDYLVDLNNNVVESELCSVYLQSLPMFIQNCSVSFPDLALLSLAFFEAHDVAFELIDSCSTFLYYITMCATKCFTVPWDHCELSDVLKLFIIRFYVPLSEQLFFDVPPQCLGSSNRSYVSLDLHIDKYREKIGDVLSSSVKHRPIKSNKRDNKFKLMSHKDVIRLSGLLQYDTNYNLCSTMLIKWHFTPFHFILDEYTATKRSGTWFESSTSEIQYCLELLRKVDELSDSRSIDYVLESIDLFPEIAYDLIPDTWFSNPRLFDKLKSTISLKQLIEWIPRLSVHQVFKNDDDLLTNAMDMLNSEELVEHSKLWPIDILIALKKYESRRGYFQRAKRSFCKALYNLTPMYELISAFGQTLDLSFRNVPFLNQRVLLCVDTRPNAFKVKGTTHAQLTSVMCSSLLAMQISRCTNSTGSNYFLTYAFAPQIKLKAVEFDENLGIEIRDSTAEFVKAKCGFGLKNFAISKEHSFEQILEFLDENGRGGLPEPSEPIDWALLNGIQVDCFVLQIFSVKPGKEDVWKGQLERKLIEYRSSMGLPKTKLIVMFPQTTYLPESILSELYLTLVGFGKNTMRVIWDYIKNDSFD